MFSRRSGSPLRDSRSSKGLRKKLGRTGLISPGYPGSPTNPLPVRVRHPAAIPPRTLMKTAPRPRDGRDASRRLPSRVHTAFALRYLTSISAGAIDRIVKESTHHEPRDFSRAPSTLSAGAISRSPGGRSRRPFTASTTNRSVRFGRPFRRVTGAILTGRIPKVNDPLKIFPSIARVTFEALSGRSPVRPGVCLVV